MGGSLPFDARDSSGHDYSTPFHSLMADIEDYAIQNALHFIAPYFPNKNHRHRLSKCLPKSAVKWK